jgi:cyclopropane fatty-acyl-phospholipid synthase-like methyltransferase
MVLLAAHRLAYDPSPAQCHAGATMTEKPFSPACERNREPILAVLRAHFAGSRSVLEIGSGSGQHAVHFAAAMPWLTWQCSDVAGNLAGIRMWLDEAGLANTPAPIALDVAEGPWPAGFDAVFSANSLHIMGWAEVEAFFAGVGRVLAGGGVLVVYGPFNDAGGYTSDSNRDFDAWLKARDPRSGLRDAGAVDALAHAAGLQLLDDVAMPANNRCLAWGHRRANG